MSGQITFKFNILTAIFLVAALVAIGLFIGKNYVKNKEIRKLEETVKTHEHNIFDLELSNFLRSDTIFALKQVIKKTNVVISDYKVKISGLNQKLATLQEDNAHVPVNVKYDALIERTAPDTLKKEYGFSGRQIGVLYDDNQAIPIMEDEINQYIGLQEAMNYNLGLSQNETRIVTDQFNTCKSQNDAYKNIISIKDKEIKLIKKQKKGRLWYSVAATTIATITTTLLITK